ncbi:MAG: hypothetical protein PHV75_04545 [Victivallaceae bacterium]|jgi:DNA polymerase III delta subunit|nr:hypothetical protein [Victivallaceae bacterium]MDD3704195.1 hypothetical protein [Victivallaceae bacterium]MDD4317767.1 hypothetical protein [Victivallaceae bacterium]MDD5664109.1 hypothetical protein [Victivallaceae bacterium]NLK83382.1 hypothetical protein [Lentisphaerota bacterium]
MGSFYLISGDDDFAIKNAAHEAAVKSCGCELEQAQDLEIINGDADDSSEQSVVNIMTALLNSLRTPPFLTPQKTIWLRHFAYFDLIQSGDAKKILSKITAEFLDFLKPGLPAEITLIIDGPGIDQRKTFFKTCQKTDAEIQFFKKERLEDKNKKGYGKSLSDTIQTACNKIGKKIDYRAVEYLISTIGNDTGRIINEIGKLDSFTGERDSITIDDCRNICSRTPEALNYEFGGALLERDVEQGLKLVDTLIEQMRSSGGGGAIELALVLSAARSFQELVKVRCAAAELGIKGYVNKGFFESVRKEDYPGNYLAGLHPFRAYKLCQTAFDFPGEKLAEIMEAILTANRKLVSGAGDPRLILEQMVIEICQG